MVIAEVDLSDLIWTTIWVFFLIMFIWVFIAIVSDLFRDHELSGWAKAIWVLALIVFPLVGSLVYLIVRGEGMARRSAAQASRSRAEFDSYVRETAASGGSQVDDLARLAQLRDNGTITAEEFETMKARVMAGSSPS
ncbi:MAG TPA: SHOCT domain-containing protein [Acidimicrobiales bacterium]|nr:SHOCT domain-containing protein [Acidimicrobiales bacterium]